LSALDALPARLQVAIAPSIGPCCYEVDVAVVEPLAMAFPSSYAEWLTPGAPGKWMLDLWAANEAQLVAAGVRPECIVNPRLCTACRRDLFHSYRKRDYGRLVTLAALPAAPAAPGGPPATA
jgi:copper oxidase (laccase) domain-containing protein